MRGLLLDVDGTLLVGERPVPGAPEWLERVRRARIAFRILTNTTRRPRREVVAALRRAGFRVEAHEVLTPALLARQCILRAGRPTALLLLPEASKEDFADIAEEARTPAWVVVGDLGAEFTWARLNEAFRALRAGARLLALQKNRWWLPDPQTGPVLDAGPWVAALEYAAGVEAHVVGKPARPFFQLAVEALGLPEAEVWMVGDDPHNDVLGAAQAGCRTVLVRTGKLSAGQALPAGVRPDRIVDSVADLF